MAHEVREAAREADAAQIVETAETADGGETAESGELGGDDGRIVTVTGPAIHGAPADSEPRRDDRTMDELRADILADLVLTSSPSAHGEGDALSMIRAHVQVTVPVLTAAGQSDEPALLAGYGPIDRETAQQLAAGAPGWDRVMFHPHTGATLAVDRYRPSAELRRFLRVRDERCRFPGCTQRPWRCDLDHTLDHALGGETRECNLAHFCRRHHTVKHATGWKVRQLGHGTLEWISLTGRRYIDRPPSLVQFVPSRQRQFTGSIARNRRKRPSDRAYPGAMTASGRAEFGPVRIAWTDAAASVPPSPSILERLGEQQVASARLAERRRRAAVPRRPGAPDRAGRAAHRRHRPRVHHDVRAVRRRPWQTAVRTRPGGRQRQLCGQRRRGGRGDASRMPRRWASTSNARRRPGRVCRCEIWVRCSRPRRHPTFRTGPSSKPRSRPTGEESRSTSPKYGSVRPAAVGAAGSRAIRIPGRVDTVDARVVAGPSGFVLSAAMVPAAGERPPG